MKIGDKIEVRYVEMPKVSPVLAVGPIKVGSPDDRIEMREVTRPAEVLSVLSSGRCCVRFEDGTHRVCRADEIL